METIYHKTLDLSAKIERVSDNEFGIYVRGSLIEKIPSSSTQLETYCHAQDAMEDYHDVMTDASRIDYDPSDIEWNEARTLTKSTRDV